MALPIIKCVHNVPPHFRYIPTLPVITQKPKRDTDEMKERLIDTQHVYEVCGSQWTVFRRLSTTKPLTAM